MSIESLRPEFDCHCSLEHDIVGAARPGACVAAHDGATPDHVVAQRAKPWCERLRCVSAARLHDEVGGVSHDELTRDARSVVATAGMPRRAASSSRAAFLAAPSSIEYSVWT